MKSLHQLHTFLNNADVADSATNPLVPPRLSSAKNKLIKNRLQYTYFLPKNNLIYSSAASKKRRITSAGRAPDGNGRTSPEIQEDKYIIKF